MRAHMAIARELHWSLAEVIYGKKAVYENNQGVSDHERTLWFALWVVEEEERVKAEAKALADAKKTRD